jgi:putative DNA primase/helicase
MSTKDNLLNALLPKFAPLDFAALVGLEKGKYVRLKQYVVCCIDNFLAVANDNNYRFGTYNGMPYFYDGAFWAQLSKDELEWFLGKAAERMRGVSPESRHYEFKQELYKQFLSASYLKTQPCGEGISLVNFPNGTFEISMDRQKLRAHNASDFLRYKLLFDYDPNADAPQFIEYLNTVLPDVAAQKVLAEYLGYVFTNSNDLKLEKVILLYGSGANGKSVFFEIVSALLGKENITNYSLQKVTTSDYTRAKLSGKLLNYASEINSNLETAVFKQLISGEPVEARLPYGEPFILSNYAKFMFNCNELPKDVEHNNAYFRRLLPIPFNVTIPDEEQDNGLAKNIIDNELPGVFNWVVVGLKRLIAQNRFTDCPLISEMVEQYKLESDTAQLFLQDVGYRHSESIKVALAEIYRQYSLFCKDSGYKALNLGNFRKRLEKSKVVIKRQNAGNFVYLALPEEVKPIVVCTAPSQPTLFTQEQIATTAPDLASSIGNPPCLDALYHELESAKVQLCRAKQ